MTFRHELASKTINALNNGSTRRTRMKAMSNSVPGQLDFVSVAFKLDMQEKLLVHPWAWQGVSRGTRPRLQMGIVERETHDST
jgi:hypothetical protein